MAPTDPICSPSRFALSLTYKTPEQHKRVNDSFCFVVGNRTKANDNNKSIKLSSSEHISSFCQPTRGLKCTYCTQAPWAAGGPGTSQPLGGQRGLDEWLEQTSLSRRREEPPRWATPSSQHFSSPTLVVDTLCRDWRRDLHRLIVFCISVSVEKSNLRFPNINYLNTNYPKKYFFKLQRFFCISLNKVTLNNRPLFW